MHWCNPHSVIQYVFNHCGIQDNEIMTCANSNKDNEENQEEVQIRDPFLPYAESQGALTMLKMHSML